MYKPYAFVFKSSFFISNAHVYKFLASMLICKCPLIIPNIRLANVSLNVKKLNCTQTSDYTIIKIVLDRLMN